jgi:hypothetical protein
MFLLRIIQCPVIQVGRYQVSSLLNPTLVTSIVYENFEDQNLNYSI